ncbi:MAG TPA: glycoside hydrolase family 43 protein [Pseudonocardia sp.]|jgi:beta-xylosidase
MVRLSLDGWIRLLVAALVVIVVVVLVASTAVTNIEPVIGRDFPDPAVLATGGSYYAYSTQSVYGGRFWHVPVQRAPELAGGWKAVGDALPALPGWASSAHNGVGDVTAPEVTAGPGGGYLLYFVAMAGARPVRCIGVASAASPAGPFLAEPGPLVCQPDTVDSIDPQVFTDVDGARYLLYSSGGHGTAIWLQRMTPDGLGLLGARRALIQADRPEEAYIVEAPSLVRQGGEYVLFYSGNTFNSGSYFANYARSPSLAGTFVKSPGEFVTRDSMGGAYINPGGQSVVHGEGQDDLVFHASLGPAERAMFAVGLTWDPAGRPVLDLSDGLTRRYRAAG